MATKKTKKKTQDLDAVAPADVEVKASTPTPNIEHILSVEMLDGAEVLDDGGVLCVNRSTAADIARALRDKGCKILGLFRDPDTGKYTVRYTPA